MTAKATPSVIDLDDGEKGAYLCKCELAVGDKLDGGLVDVPCTIKVFGVDLLECGVLEPEIL